MSNVTAKVKLNNKQPWEDQSVLTFVADYEDGRNKEWAKFTPALSLSMTVKNSVAEHFETGKSYTLTFSED